MIRLIVQEDALTIYEEVHRSREHLKNLIWSSTATAESVASFVEALIQAEKRSLYGIFHEDKFCGCVEIRYFDEHAEIGYWLGVEHRGKHILQDNLRELKNMLHIAHMTAKVKHNNVKSYQILHSIFDMEAVSKDDTWIYLSS